MPSYTQYGYEVAGTLTRRADSSPCADRGQNIVCYKPKMDIIVIDRAAFNQGANAQYPPHIEITQVMDAIIARGPHAVSYAPPMDEPTRSGRSARGISRGSGANTSTRGRSW